MSDTLRDLVVSLSLNSDNFTRNLKSITRQIQEAQSEFRLASAGVTGFESSTSGLSAKLNTLQRTLQLQKNAVGQYERALTAARNKLTECYTRQGEYAEKLKTAKARQADAAKQVQSAAETGGTVLEDFASVAGVSASQFKAMWDADPSSAFMAFIEGLAKMDDEGISAIATLSDIGISEVRLRDTMLRSVNATDLFAEALSMADTAWEENTALSTEANKRYATTESKLTNLKNKALLVAQTFGDDLNPTLQKIIEGVSDFVDKLSTLDTSLKMDFGADTVAELSTYVSEMVKAIQQGEQLPEEDLQNLQDIVDFLNGLDVTDTGAHIKEGIAQGMTEAGFASDAETVASNLETALNTALDIHSPSKRVAPVGENVSAGVGEGMTGYSFASSAERIAQSIQSALKATLTVSSLRAIGVNAMAGLAAGIRAGQANVVAAMRAAAQSAVTAAKTELKIHSPSRVFRDEVGAQVMRGFGLGVERETGNQAKVIANAARFLTGEAKEASIGYNTSYDQRKYDQSSSVSVSGNSFYIREEQDVRSLAIEIAALTRRQREAIPQTRTQRPRLWVMGEQRESAKKTKLRHCKFLLCYT